MKFIFGSHLEKLTKCRGINHQAFKSIDGLNLYSPFQQHVAWVYEHILSIPYPTVQPIEGIARYHHGVQHATRASIYAVAWINLYRRYGDKDALALTEEDVRLIQIALLFHDTARMGDGKDEWDKESGDFLYYYLTRVLGVEEEKARVLQDAVANKEKKPPNIYQKIIHDADCLDIIRARPHFDANHLHFYKEIVCKKSKDPDFKDFNTPALNDMAKLIVDAGSLIETQGDGHKRNKNALKKEYDSKEVFGKTMKDISSKPHSTLANLAFLLPQAEQKQEIRTEEKEEIKEEAKIRSQEEKKSDISDEKNPYQEIDEKMLYTLIEKGRVLGRSITSPHAVSEKNEEKETAARKEFRKAHRRLGAPTRTKKKDEKGNPLNTKKHGNLHRSTTLLGAGTPTFGNAGMLIIDFDLKAVEEICTKDYASGFGKKKRTLDPLSLVEKKEMLSQLMHTQKMGGDSQSFGETITTFNEILYHVTSYNAVYFSFDPSPDNHYSFRNYYTYHPHIPALQAIFLRNEYEQINGVCLPIFEYSGIHGFVVKREFSEEEILQMWVQMCTDHIENEIKKGNSEVLDLTIDQLKIAAMFIKPGWEYCPADSNYPEAFQKKITETIAAVRDKIIEQQIENIEKKESFLERSKCPRVILSNPIIQPLAHRLAEKIHQSTYGNYTLLLSESKAFSPLYAALFKSKEEFLKKISDLDFLYAHDITKLFYIAKSSNMQKMVEEIQKNLSDFLLKNKATIFEWIALNSLFELKEEKRISKIATDHFSCSLRNIEFQKKFTLKDFEVFHQLIKDINVFKNFGIETQEYDSRLYTLLWRMVISCKEVYFPMIAGHTKLIHSMPIDTEENRKNKKNLVNILKKHVESLIKQIDIEGSYLFYAIKNIDFVSNVKNIDSLITFTIQLKELSFFQDDLPLFTKIIKLYFPHGDLYPDPFKEIDKLKKIIKLVSPLNDQQKDILKKQIQNNILNNIIFIRDHKYQDLLRYTIGECLNYIKSVFSCFRETIIDDEFLIHTILYLRSTTEIASNILKPAEWEEIKSWAPKSVFQKLQLIQSAATNDYKTALSLLQSIPHDRIHDTLKTCEEEKEKWNLTLKIEENMTCLFHLVFDMRHIQSNEAAPSEEKERAAAIQRLITYLNAPEKSNAEIKSAISRFQRFERSAQQGARPDYAAYTPHSLPEKSGWAAWFSSSQSSTPPASGGQPAPRSSSI